MLSEIDFLNSNPKALTLQIAINAKTRRLELNLTQEELAQKSGVSLGSVKRFESKHEISLKHLLLIAVVLNSTEDFKNLFLQKQYRSIDEVVVKKEMKRKRARKK